ncbi:MAG TPA: glycosyltransferase [Solirubrobacteraceae bacterium]
MSGRSNGRGGSRGVAVREVRQPRRHNVLWVTCHLPFSPASGGRRREYELIRRLSRRYSIDLVAITKTIEQDRLHIDEARSYCRNVSLYRADDASSAAAAPQVSRHGCKRATRDLARILGRGREVDLVHVEGFYLAQHLPPRAGAPVLLVEQNIEYQLWEQRMQSAAEELARTRLRHRMLATREAELGAWRRADACATVTERDRETMLEAIPSLEVSLVPDGADHSTALARVPSPPAVPAQTDSGAPLIVQVGNFAYEPNLDAALHMCEAIFPRIRAANPDAHLLFVGAAPPPKLRAAAVLAPNVTVTGLVPDVEPYLRRATVVVFPLRVGGGVKVKLIEALRQGCAIVTTAVGLQGLEGARGGAVRVAEHPQQLADAVVRLLDSQQERRRLGRAARAFGDSLPTWSEAAASLAQAYERLLEPMPLAATPSAS